MEEMIRIVGVRFKRAGKIYYFTPGDLPVAVGDEVLVETASGVECGQVVIPAKDVPISDVVQPVRKVLRHMEPADREQLLANRSSERDAQAFAAERIAARGLPMKLVGAEYTFDRSRLTFFFVAEDRVDFRELVKDLASRFGVRIELRQIGVRDQAKDVGGIGLCGRELCCTTWLGEFAPVSIRMAKEQELSLNPSKLTGQCGRLKCCLKYEADTYRRIRELLPELGAMVRTASGTGQVSEVLVARESVVVNLGEGRRTLVSLAQLESGEAVVLTGKRSAAGLAVSAASGADDVMEPQVAGIAVALETESLDGEDAGGPPEEERSSRRRKAKRSGAASHHKRERGGESPAAGAGAHEETGAALAGDGDREVAWDGAGEEIWDGAGEDPAEDAGGPPEEEPARQPEAPGAADKPRKARRRRPRRRRPQRREPRVGEEAG